MGKRIRLSGSGAVILVLSIVVSFQPGHGWAAETKPSAGQRLIYRTPRGIEFQIDEGGLASIHVGTRQLARGGWSAFNAEPWFKASGSGRVSTLGPRSQSIAVLNDHHARVRHAQGDLVCVADYDFEGEDLSISTRVENNHADEPLNVVGFAGLEFTFDRPPEGVMPVQHISYFQSHGVGLCHPGHWSRIGGSYAVDDSVGVGLSPWKTGWQRTLFLWDYADWNPGKREALPKRRLMYFVVSPVPARGSRTIDVKIRVSPNRDWKHLLAPYREHFRETFGAVRYQADHRWITSDYLNHSQQAVSPSNPYGFHGGARRFDRAEGIREFCDRAIPVLKDSGGQGVIIWGQGGDDPRGGMYRPDFDVLPPEVAANWAVLSQRFRDAGLKLGVCTRPADMAVRLDWKSDQIIAINADDPGHQAMLRRRFDNMVQRGCTLFYLDSFGNDLEHVKLMRVLREKLGPTVLTFCEHQCDAILPFSGGYSETTLHAGPGRPPAYGVWSGLENWQIYQWLAPGAQLISRLYQVEGKAPADFEPVDRFFLRHRITPLLPTNDFPRAATLAKIQPEFIDRVGQWRRTEN